MPFFPGMSEQNLPPWLLDIYQSIAHRARQLAEAPHEHYRGERIAPIPTDIQTAHYLGKQYGLYEPYLRRAEEMMEGAQAPFYEQYQKYMNPYQQAVVNRISEEGMRNLNENIIPALEAKFVKLGQHGSSRHADLSKRAAREIQNEISANQAKALSSGYQQAAQLFNADMARRLEGAREMSTLGGLKQAGRLADIAALGEQGRYQQQQEQAKRDVAYQDFLRQLEYPHQMLAQQTGVMSGVPVPTQSTTMYQTPGAPQMNILGQLGNLAGNIYGARLATNKKRGGSIRETKPHIMALLPHVGAF
jgi:hypothetical protein